jgi:hypothetical protein
VAGSDLESVREAFGFWKTMVAVIKGAAKYPQGFSIIDNRKNGKPLGLCYFYWRIIAFC